MDACPVSCIHWVSKDDLPALEFVCQNKVGSAGGSGQERAGLFGSCMGEPSPAGQQQCLSGPTAAAATARASVW